MKKILSLIIAMMMLAVGFALAEDSQWEFDTYSYSLDGYLGDGGDVTIPDVIQDCTVDIIGLNAFNSADGITSLTLPATLRQIEGGAISFCSDLTGVALNDGLLIVEDNCFSGNPLLEQVTIPASVCYIGSNSFSDCESLSEVVFEGPCPVFAGTAFDWIADDAVIRVPDDQYDAYFTAFEEMELYPVLEKSGSNAQPAQPSVAQEQFAFDAATGTITGYQGYDVRVDVPAEIGGVAVTAIGDEAFLNCNYLCFLTLPEGVEQIGSSAFEGCTRLLHVDFPSTLRTIGSRAFADSLQAWSLDFPEGLESIGDEAFVYAAKLSGALQLPQGLTSVGSRAFASTYWLEEVYVPDSVQTIGENAFFDSGLNYVVFEGLQLPEMPDNVFAECWNLADIDLNTKADKQQMLSMQAVVDALELDCRVWRMQNPDVDYIYDGLDTYENGVMLGYDGEQTHIRPFDNYDDITVTAVGDGAFRGNQIIEYFSVPYNDMFTTIGAEAFADSCLARIDLFDSVTTIGDGAFRGCTQLTELTLPESVTSVGAEALSGCTGLQRLIVLCDPSLLPQGALENCPADMEIYAGENATDDQLKHLSDVAGRPFYAPVTRVGEPLPQLTDMPYEPLPEEDFWSDSEFARIDAYQGYELNLVLPREIDGVPMSMVGGSMMQRAYSDEFTEAELPVVSVVIPETYTEIPPYAFQNSASLETVICYAPVETLADCTFQNCTALREVIFVNGVHGLGEYVFDNCPNLETVYLGAHAENISEFAFLDQTGETVWSLDKCITDPALLPDVDALLAAVAREPMAAPEPEPAPEAVPVGEEGAPFFGTWQGVEIIMGGEVHSLSEFDMVMTLMLCEDGRMIFSDSDSIDLSLVGDGDWYAWRVENGTALADMYTMVILDDGRLSVDEDGLQILFVRGEASAASADAPAAQSDAPAGAAIAEEVRYVCVSASVEGVSVDASMLGGEHSVVLHGDGSADFVIAGVDVPGITWSPTAAGFELNYYGTPMEGLCAGTGFDMDYYGAMLLHFEPEM